MNSDFVNGALCLFGGMIWAAIARQWVPDAKVGVAIIFVPARVLMFVGAPFLSADSESNLRQLLTSKIFPNWPNIPHLMFDVHV